MLLTITNRFAMPCVRPAFVAVFACMLAAPFSHAQYTPPPPPLTTAPCVLDKKEFLRPAACRFHSSRCSAKAFPFRATPTSRLPANPQLQLPLLIHSLFLATPIRLLSRPPALRPLTPSPSRMTLARLLPAPHRVPAAPVPTERPRRPPTPGDPRSRTRAVPVPLDPSVVTSPRSRTSTSARLKISRYPATTHPPAIFWLPTCVRRMRSRPSPDDPAAHFALAESARRLSKRDEAIAEYKLYLKLDPEGEKVRVSQEALATLDPK